MNKKRLRREQYQYLLRRVGASMCSGETLHNITRHVAHISKNDTHEDLRRYITGCICFKCLGYLSRLPQRTVLCSEPLERWSMGTPLQTPWLVVQ